MHQDSSSDTDESVGKGRGGDDTKVVDRDSDGGDAPANDADKESRDTEALDTDAFDADEVDEHVVHVEDDSPARTRGRGWIVLSLVLFLALATFVSTTAYLWDITRQWEARAGELTRINYELGEDLVNEQEVVLTHEEQIALLSDQLETLQQRVLDLATVVSQSDDNVATAEQQIAGLNDLLDKASAVSNAMNRCVDSQDELAEFLRAAEEYDEEELQAYEESVNDLCAAAESANAQFQRSITP
jgi:hypothetical protein